MFFTTGMHIKLELRCVLATDIKAPTPSRYCPERFSEAVKNILPHDPAGAHKHLKFVGGMVVKHIRGLTSVWQIILSKGESHQTIDLHSLGKVDVVKRVCGVIIF